MIVYTVFDPHEGTEMMFPTQREAIAFAKRQGVGTFVERTDIGRPTKQRICDCYNREGFAVSSEKIFELPD